MKNKQCSAEINRKKNRALFLDRDGILIEDVSYPHKPKDLHLRLEIIPHLTEAVKRGYLLIIVTNQAGLARGKFTLDQYNEFHKLLIKELQRHQVEISSTYFCPFHKEGVVPEYTGDSMNRKPNPGMILQAARDFDIDIKKSFMIGDKDSDRIDLPELRSCILQGQYPLSEDKKIFRDFEALFTWIKRNEDV